MTCEIWIIEETLSDGSNVYNVEVRSPGDVLVLHAVTEEDAMALADKLRAAINEHTVDGPRRPNLDTGKTAAVA